MYLSQIKRADVDAYGSSSSALHVLKFHVNPKPNCSKRLHRKVKITGATQSDLSVHITCYPPQGKSYVFNVLLKCSCTYDYVGHSH